jgi:hypothetical protein
VDDKSLTQIESVVPQPDKWMRKMRNPLILAALAGIAVLMFVQFGPAVVFGAESASFDHVRAIEPLKLSQSVRQLFTNRRREL